MALTIAAIEDEIVAALQASTLSETCKKIDSYSGQIDDLIKEVASMIIGLPAVYVLYFGSRFSEVANRSFDDEMIFTVVSIAKSLRGRAELRTGIYEMLEVEKTTLINNNLGLNIEPLHPQTIEPAMITNQFSVFSFDLKTSQSID